MVERRVAEGADDDRVVRPGRLHAEAPRALDREGDADRARQVRGDRRRLRDHREVVMPEHLVPPARDRLVGGRCHPEQDVPGAVVTCLARAGEVEGARPVVEERRVARAERQCDERVRLVPRRADGVEAEPS